MPPRDGLRRFKGSEALRRTKCVDSRVLCRHVGAGVQNFGSTIPGLSALRRPNPVPYTPHASIEPAFAAGRGTLEPL